MDRDALSSDLANEKGQKNEDFFASGVPSNFRLLLLVNLGNKRSRKTMARYGVIPSGLFYL
jgi:hypothetical protein